MGRLQSRRPTATSRPGARSSAALAEEVGARALRRERRLVAEQVRELTHAAADRRVATGWSGPGLPCSRARGWRGLPWVGTMPQSWWPARRDAVAGWSLTSSPVRGSACRRYELSSWTARAGGSPRRTRTVGARAGAPALPCRRPASRSRSTSDACPVGWYRVRISGFSTSACTALVGIGCPSPPSPCCCPCWRRAASARPRFRRGPIRRFRASRYELVLLAPGGDPRLERTAREVMGVHDRWVRCRGRRVRPLRPGGGADRSTLGLPHRGPLRSQPHCLEAMLEHLERTGQPGARGVSVGVGHGQMGDLEREVFEEHLTPGERRRSLAEGPHSLAGDPHVGVTDAGGFPARYGDFARPGPWR